MQSNETIRTENSRSSSFGISRGLETPSLSLPDAEAFKLGSERLLSAERLLNPERPPAPSSGERRTRHPDTEDRRNGIFERLVSGDEDVAGLLAYSIYKQNKRDWLKAFETARNRAPTLDEEIAYTLGESTPRRLAIYRHIAEETFVGQGPPKELATGEAGAARVIQTGSAARAAAAQRAQTKTPVIFALYAGVLVLAGLGLWVIVRYLSSVAH